MRETAITLLACAMVLLPAPVALASQQTAAVAVAPGTGPSAVEPRSDSPSPSSSSPGDPDDSEKPDNSEEPDEPEESGKPGERPTRPSWPTLTPWLPGDSTPTPTPTPTPTSGEPSGEPSGTDRDRGWNGDGGEDDRAGTRRPEDGASAEPSAASRQTPPSWTGQISDRRTGGVDHYGEYDYGDDQGRGSDTRYTENRATPATGGQLLPVLPLGAGLTFLGLGLASFALRLRR